MRSLHWGGYGRQEQCIHSDVDLIFLFNKTIPSEAEDLIHEVIYPLWDADFRSRASVIRSFERILVSRAEVFGVLDEMLDTGFYNFYMKNRKIARRL